MIVRKETRRLLYLLMATQPIPLILLWLDLRIDTLRVSRDLVFWTVAIPWGAAVVTVLSILKEFGFNTGRPWVRWTLAIVVTYAVHAYAIREIYLSFIVPVNFIILPLLSLGLAHLIMRESS